MNFRGKRSFGQVPNCKVLKNSQVLSLDLLGLQSLPCGKSCWGCQPPSLGVQAWQGQRHTDNVIKRERRDDWRETSWVLSHTWTDGCYLVAKGLVGALAPTGCWLLPGPLTRTQQRKQRELPPSSLGRPSDKGRYWEAMQQSGSQSWGSGSGHSATYYVAGTEDGSLADTLPGLCTPGLQPSANLRT